jgi:hypothetical protein
MTSFLAFENVPKAFLENIAIEDILSHFQSSNRNTDSVIPIPLLFVKPAPLIRELNLSFFHVSAKILSMYSVSDKYFHRNSKPHQPVDAVFS